MAILSKGTTYSDGDQVTSSNLNALVDSATFASGAVDDSTTQLSSGKIIVKDLGIATGKIAASAVTTAKIADSNVTKAKIENLADYKVLGNVSGGAAAPAEVAILDEDNMSSDSATSLATQQSIKAYVDTQITAEDLDFAGDSGSSSVDLDSQTFTIAGSTGLDTTASGQTLTVALDLNEVTTETSIAQDDFVIMVDNTDSANGKITFSNLEDTVFGNVSGAVAIAAGGAATVSAVTVADESSDTTCFPLFATAATGSLGPKSGSNLTFNSSSGLLTATTLSGILADGVTATTQSASDNSTKVATTAYVDAQVGTSDALSEVLAVGNTTGSTNIVVDNGQSITTNTISETTSGSGVTIDGVLVKDNGITASGTISLGATSFNDNNITNVGSIALDTITNDGTDVTIDSSGDIILDADGAQVRIKDAGTERFVFNTDATPELDVTGGDFTIHSTTSDADIIFTGNDGGSGITALTLDMSAAGAATFNDKITATELVISGNIDIDGTTNLDAVDIDGAVDMASTLTVADDANFDSGTLFVDASADRVGIGTTSPSHKLHLSEGSTDFAALIANSTSSGNGLKINAGDNSGDRILQLNDKDGNEKLRVGATGLVGIGNASPSSTLDVTGTLAVSGNVDFNGDLDVEGTSNLDVVDIDGAVDMASTLNVAGDVGVGTTSPGSHFHVKGSSDRPAIFESTDAFCFVSLNDNSTSAQTAVMLGAQGDDLRIDAGDSERIRVESGGNVGIGTSSPGSKLEVNGTTTISGDTVLNSDLEINVVGSSNGSKAIVINSSGTNFESDDGMIRLLHPSTGSGALTGGYFMKFNANSSDKFTVKGNGDTAIAGALSKGSGSFKIAHPLESKRDTHNLVHSFLEGPQADLLYRGRVDLVDGVASVNIDTASGMTDGTFVLLCRDVQSFTTNESGWTAVRSSVDGNILTIEAQDNTCTDSISWMVVGERQDEHMYETEWTDENGKVIVEPLIPPPPPPPEPELEEELEPEAEAEEETTE